MLPIQAHDAILKQIQDDREQQKLRRQGKLSAATSCTVTASASNAAADDKPPPEKKIDDTALLQVVVHWNYSNFLIFQPLEVVHKYQFHCILPQFFTDSPP